MSRLKEILARIGRNPVTLVLVLCAAISVTVLIRDRWRGDNWKRAVESDGCGYYAYLPAVFIYQDLQYRFYLDLEKKYHFGDLSTNFLYTENGKFYNKYFCGTAIVQTPFFLAACALSYLTGQDIDGHSPLFHAFVSIAAIFYALAGLFALSKYLRKFFSSRIIAISIGAIFLGTNLFNYTVYESSYSHSYSFSFICFLIYFADRSFRNNTRSSYVLVALFAALVVLIRPSNLVVVLSLPFIAGSWQVFRTWISAALKPLTSIFAVMAGLIPVGIQSLLYHAQVGTWWIDGYPYERFYFNDPNILNVLFSYRAGLFLYSPAAIPAIAGLFLLVKKSSYTFFSFAAFMFVNLWVISSWWAWHYAGTFGMRPMVDHMAFIIILVCYALSSIKARKLKVIAYTLLTALVLYGQILNYQIIRSLLPHDLMTKEKYWYIFLKTEPHYSFDLDPPYAPEIPRPLDKIMIRHFDFKSQPETELPVVFQNFNASETLNYPGTGNCDLVKMDLSYLKGCNRFYGDLRLKVKYPSLYTSGTILVCFMKKEEIFECHSIPVISPQFKPGVWNDIRLSFKSSASMQDADAVLIRMTNGNKYAVQLQELQLALASY